MEREIKITDNTEQNIVAVAEELKKVGLGDFASSFFVDDDFSGPFFKIVKDFAAESDTDATQEVIFLDVGEEYTVHTRLGHEHFRDVKKAVELIKGLYDETLAEVALCFSTVMARFVIQNTGDPQKNIEEINKNAQELMGLLNNFAGNLKLGGHVHLAFEAAYPYSLQIIPQDGNIYGYQLYLQSVIIGYHSEIFVVR